MPIPDKFLVEDGRMPFHDLAPAEAAELLRTGNDEVCLLDVRTAGEHARHRLPGSRLIPIQELVSRVAELDRDTPILVYCEHGVRSMQAAAWLKSIGFARVFNLRGGIVCWPGPKVEGSDG